MEKPKIQHIAPSPLLQKAALMSQELAKDNERIFSFLREGGDPSAISIEVQDDKDPDQIDLHLMLGVLEHQGQSCLPPDDTEITGEWHKIA